MTTPPLSANTSPSHAFGDYDARLSSNAAVVCSVCGLWVWCIYHALSDDTLIKISNKFDLRANDWVTVNGDDYGEW